jgi:hypothetical protein
MDSDRSTVHQLFKPERNFCVPLYQQAYVWNEPNQWSRLWSDIQEKAENRLAADRQLPHALSPHLREAAGIGLRGAFGAALLLNSHSSCRGIKNGRRCRHLH